MTDSDKHPVRGVNTIREELRKERDGNTYKAAFGALATAVVGTLLSYAGYEWANRIYIWLWLGTGAVADGRARTVVHTGPRLQILRPVRREAEAQRVFLHPVRREMHQMTAATVRTCM